MVGKSILSVMKDGEENEKPLDELLSLRGKPFADWKEERKYLREKWGVQGRHVKTDFTDFKDKKKYKGIKAKES